MQLVIAGSDRTSDLIRNSGKVDDELQERPNRAEFKLGSGSRPSDYSDVKLYESFEITAVDGTTITVDYGFFTNEATQNLRVGDTLTIDIAESGEIEKTITVVEKDSATGRVKMTVTPAGADGTVTKKAGIKNFAGNALSVRDKNKEVLTNIEYVVRCTDYTRIFDKKSLNDTYVDKDSRYIVNDFCNVTINKNQVIDAMDYANNAAIQAEWIESGDGDNPTTDTSDLREGTASGVLPWTFAGGTATFEATPSSLAVEDFTGAASGTPTKGRLGIWYETSDNTALTSFVIRIGSSNVNYAQITITPTTDNWTFSSELLEDATIVGTPDWTAVDYVAIVVTETASANIRIDGIRFLEKEFFKHYPYVETSIDFDDFRIPRTKPSEVMQRLADELAWYWYIDYDRNIHLFKSTTNNAPFNLTETSNNFTGLTISHDTSRLINRQVVEGGDETSTSKYNQVEEGDSIKREWLTKNKFKNLEVFLDDGSSTDLMEAGTTTTTVKATGHGLAVDDYIVNRTRSNAVRKVLTVSDPNTFTVTAVTAQVSGDTFSLFVSKIVGVEGINVDAGNNYMSNFNEKSIRSAESEATIDAGDFLLFRYNEVFPIIVQRAKDVSINNMISILGHSDGIFDGQVIKDRTLKSRPEARKVAEAQLTKYSNTIIVAKFSTTVRGLRTGQLINIKDTSSSTRNIDQQFVIQKVKLKQVEEGENTYAVTCSSLLFGVVELLQQLLRTQRKLEVAEDATIDHVRDADETIVVTDVLTTEVDGNKQSETITVGDNLITSVFTPPFKWEISAASVTRWSLFSWG